MKWKRVSIPDHPAGPRYESSGWVIQKSFYADGPTLFVWIVTGPRGQREEYKTLRAAKDFADAYETSPWIDRSLDEAGALGVADAQAGHERRTLWDDRLIQSDAWCKAYDKAYYWKAYGPGRFVSGDGSTLPSVMGFAIDEDG